MGRYLSVIIVANPLSDLFPIACTWDILPRTPTCFRGWRAL